MRDQKRIFLAKYEHKFYECQFFIVCLWLTPLRYCHCHSQSTACCFSLIVSLGLNAFNSHPALEWNLALSFFLNCHCSYFHFFSADYIKKEPAHHLAYVVSIGYGMSDEQLEKGYPENVNELNCNEL